MSIVASKSTQRTRPRRRFIAHRITPFFRSKVTPLLSPSLTCRRTHQPSFISQTSTCSLFYIHTYSVAYQYLCEIWTLLTKQRSTRCRMLFQLQWSFALFIVSFSSIQSWSRNHRHNNSMVLKVSALICFILKKYETPWSQVTSYIPYCIQNRKMKRIEKHLFLNVNVK